jgi:bacterioferritin-associated ferredoxin
MTSIFRAAIVGGDEVEVVLHLNGQIIDKSEWKVIGREALYVAVHGLKSQMKGPLSSLSVPEGRSPEQLLLRELVLKIKGLWGDAPSDPELCHCRKISQANVERGIILGAHSIEKVRQRTSANTGCGTCMPEIEELLKKYLQPVS